MIPISINTDAIQDMFSLEQEQIDDMKELAIKRIAKGFQQQWRVEAGVNLKQAREIYRNSIKIEYSQRYSATVYLDPLNWLPNALENGFSSFDMKTGFLKSDKVKFSKNGDPFLTIPFRFATPGAIGDNPAFNGGVLPKEIYNKAKGSDKSLGIGDIPSKYQIPKSNALRKRLDEIKIDSLKESQRTSIYEGLKNTGGGYMTFRRVSLKSNANSWIHPGFTEMNLAKGALDKFEPQISDIVGASIDDFLDDLGL